MGKYRWYSRLKDRIRCRLGFHHPTIYVNKDNHDNVIVSVFCVYCGREYETEVI